MTSYLHEISEERTIPHNLEAEAGVLGSLLLYPERLDIIRGLISDDDFYSEQYKIIFSALVDMSDASLPVDELTLKDHLTKKEQLDAAGGTLMLADLAGAVPNSANLSYYAQIVREKSVLRRLILASTEILDEAYSAGKPADEVLDWSEHQIYQIAEHGTSSEISSFKEILRSAMEQLEQLAAREDTGSTTGVATDFHQLDQMTGGFHGSELIIVAGRPSMGKSTFVLNILANVAIKQGKPCALFSIEMSKENIARNMLCSYGKFAGHNVRTGHLRGEEWERLGLVAGEMAKAPLFIDDTAAISLGELRGKCRRMKRQTGLELVAIDYLQLMQGPGRGREQNRQQEISEISRGLKALSRELDVPVIALSQLNRGVEDRADHKPMLSDLRESGAIEQDADLVCLLHRPSYYTQDEEDKTAQVIIAKQRNGPTGTVELIFINEQMRFENISTHGDDEYI
ncbi:MAG: replicative DNA helicase [Planctomycetota bacterium]|jgi:replicative DNA helicase